MIIHKTGHKYIKALIKYRFCINISVILLSLLIKQQKNVVTIGKDEVHKYKISINQFSFSAPLVEIKAKILSISNIGQKAINNRVGYANKAVRTQNGKNERYAIML